MYSKIIARDLWLVASRTTWKGRFPAPGHLMPLQYHFEAPGKTIALKEYQIHKRESLRMVSEHIICPLDVLFNTGHLKIYPDGSVSNRSG